MSDPPHMLQFDRARIDAMLEVLERMVAGDMKARLPLGTEGDELDAIAHAINVLSDELRWASERMLEAERREAAQLRIRAGVVPVASAKR